MEEAIENQDDQDVEAERSEDETDYEDEDIVFNHLQNAADQHEPTIELQNSYYHSFENFLKDVKIFYFNSLVFPQRTNILALWNYQ